jgi:hypothetical protein
VCGRLGMTATRTVWLLLLLLLLLLRLRSLLLQLPLSDGVACSPEVDLRRGEHIE